MGSTNSREIISYWAGKYSPEINSITAEALFDPVRAFRESKESHGKFDAVYLMERNLGTFHQWPIILNEAIRLLKYGENTELTIRFTESSFLTIFRISNFLARRNDLVINSFDQKMTTDRMWILKLSLTRKAGAPTLESLDFGIVTDGKRNDNVRKFLDSVEKAKADLPIECKVIICGPKSELLDLGERGFEIQIIDNPPEFRDKGWITRKKNLIAEKSDAENILIVHDRYALASNFFKQLLEYGPDFSVVVPQQSMPNGLRFPDWVTLSSEWEWTAPYLMNPDDYNPNSYINGGAILAKRQILLDNPWNELLFWNQGEDVELTRRLQQMNITPAYAKNIQLLVTEVREGYVDGFIYGNPNNKLNNKVGLSPNVLIFFGRLVVNSRIFLRFARSSLGLKVQKTGAGRRLGNNLSKFLNTGG